MNNVALAKEVKNKKPDFVIDDYFVKLGATEEHLAVAKEILSNPMMYEVKYLRHPPIVVKRTVKQEDADYKHSQVPFSCYDMVRGPAYGCVILIYPKDLSDASKKTLKELGVSDDTAFGWSCSVENYVTSKKSIKIYAILRAFFDEPSVIELKDGYSRVVGTNTNKIIPREVQATLLKCMDLGFSW